MNSVKFKCLVEIDDESKIIASSFIDVDDENIPSYQASIFDCDFLHDGETLEGNIDNLSDIPKMKGIYTCIIEIVFTQSWTECGTEYDANLTATNFEKIINLLKL